MTMTQNHFKKIKNRFHFLLKMDINNRQVTLGQGQYLLCYNQ